MIPDRPIPAAAIQPDRQRRAAQRLADVRHGAVIALQPGIRRRAGIQSGGAGAQREGPVIACNGILIVCVPDLALPQQDPGIAVSGVDRQRLAIKSFRLAAVAVLGMKLSQQGQDWGSFGANLSALAKSACAFCG
jgi:hypothetical protein